MCDPLLGTTPCRKHFARPPLARNQKQAFSANQIVKDGLLNLSVWSDDGPNTKPPADLGSVEAGHTLRLV
jgi:hypothetical protein